MCFALYYTPAVDSTRANMHLYTTTECIARTYRKPSRAVSADQSIPAQLNSNCSLLVPVCGQLWAFLHNILTVCSATHPCGVGREQTAASLVAWAPQVCLQLRQRPGRRVTQKLLKEAKWGKCSTQKALWHHLWSRSLCTIR